MVSTTKERQSSMSGDVDDLLDLKSVLISDPIDPICVQILEQAGVKVTCKSKVPPAELIKIIPEYDGIIVRSGTTVTKEVIEASNLKIIGRAGTGVDNIDVPAATKKGIIVMNTPGGNTLSAAEHTCALICSLARNIPQANMALKQGRWDRKKYMGNELNGKTLVILGLGRIGREVATRMQAFGMVTIGYDPILPKEVAKSFNVELLGLEELWPRADFITVHTPLIAATRGLLNDESMAKCKKGFQIVNCARGGIIDEAALLRAVESGQCGGAALDVFEEEPPADPAHNALIQNDKVVVTPHLGASTEEAQAKVAREIADQFVDAANGRAVNGSINAVAITHALGTKMKPWVALASKLGLLTAQLILGSAFTKAEQKELVRIKVLVQGKHVQGAAKTLTSAVLAGLLNHLQSTPVNLVNAFDLASEMGINVSSESILDQHAVYQNVVTVRVLREDGEHDYAGTVFGKGQQRLTTVDNFAFEVKPEGAMVFYRNEDRPGVLAQVSKTLFEHHINIADFNMGREGREALTIINADSHVSDEVCEQIRQIDFVTHCRSIEL